MKINRFGRAEILTPDQINLLFTEGFVNPRDRWWAKQRHRACPPED
ncbi:hypothetical protein [Nostoc sp.]